MRLIDADNLLQQIEERIKESGKHRMAVLADELIDIVNDYAEDYENAEPVKHGHWIRTSENVSTTQVQHCSECGHNTNYDFPYCSNCGAKMDGGADE